MITRRLACLVAVTTLLAAAAIASVHPVHASGPVDALKFVPSDGAMAGTRPGSLAPGGSLAAGGMQTVTITAMSGGLAVGAGEPVYVWFQHQDPTSTGGTASISGSALPSTKSTAFTTDASGNITVAYAAPNPTQVFGRDVINAQDVATSVTNWVVYDSSTVTHYTFTPAAPIAAPGSLPAGTQVGFTVTARNAANAGVAGSDILLNITPAASGGGSASATSATTGTKPLAGVFLHFIANGSGQVPITYTAGTNINGATDTITAENYGTGPNFESLDTYTFPSTAAAVYTAVTPYRLADTRTNSGHALAGAHLGAGQSVALQVTTVDGVPPSATAAVLNLTATNPTASSFLAVNPTSFLGTSNLNFVAGQTVANLVTVPLSGTGSVNIYNLAGTTDAVVDLEGYFTPGTGPAGLYNALAPARIADTRSGSNQPNAGQTLGAVSVIRVQATSVGGVPASGVSAVVLNVTAAGPTAPSFLTVYPDGQLRPTASNLNFTAGQVVPNRVIVPLGAGGGVDIYNLAGRVDAVVDVGGYFTDATMGGTGSRFTPISPTRVADTRAGSGQPLAGGTLGPASTIAVSMAPAGLPGGALAVAANVTVVNGSIASYLTAFPGGGTPNGASDLNWVPGQVVPNLVVTRLGSNVLDLYNNSGTVDAVVDVFGYWS